MLWIPITLLAAVAQTLRFMFQKRLRISTLSTGGATFARFLYAAPLIALVAIGYASVRGYGMPVMEWQFWAFAAVGGFCQTQSPMSLPVKKPRKKFVTLAEHAFLILRDDKILLSKGSGSRRKGFWHLPLRSEDESARFEEESQHRYTITHYRVTVHLYRVSSFTRIKGEEFHSLDSLEELPIASPVRKIIKASL